MQTAEALRINMDTEDENVRLVYEKSTIARILPGKAPRPSFLSDRVLERVWQKFYASNPNAFNAPRWDYLGSEEKDGKLVVYLGNSDYCSTQAAMRFINRRLQGLNLHYLPALRNAMLDFGKSYDEVMKFGLNQGLALLVEVDDPKHGQVLVLGKRSGKVAYAPNALMLPAGGVMPAHYSSEDIAKGEINMFVSARRQLKDEVGIDTIPLLNIGNIRDREEAPNATELYVTTEPLAQSVEEILASHAKAKDKYEHDGLRLVLRTPEGLLALMQGSLETDVMGQPLKDVSTLGVCYAGLLLYGQARYGNSWAEDATSALWQRGVVVTSTIIRKWNA